MKTILTVFLLSLTVSAAEPFASGVPVGKRPGPYSFLVATGPQRGQPTCYICEQDNKPTVVVFARSLGAPLGKLLVKLDDVATKQADQGFKAWMTHITPTADLDALAKWSKQEGLKTVAVGAFEDADGPPAYTLHKDADVTVLVFIKKRVTANFALRNDELNDAKIDNILKAVAALK